MVKFFLAPLPPPTPHYCMMTGVKGSTGVTRDARRPKKEKEEEKKKEEEKEKMLP